MRRPPLIETCKLNSVEPLSYLADLLTWIASSHPNSRIDEVLPWDLHPYSRAQGCGRRTPLTEHRNPPKMIETKPVSRKTATHPPRELGSTFCETWP
ncbi:MULTISPECIES: transposase domain-containing protein [Mesorhizobium]|uniref:transposase domain-containing protein n=1 Tax=Mesorhizobium TaxID=68287 RepID=UPI0021E97797|nr:transposase domain-containing protein [Mesorhizobium sp. ZC-5]MCV3244026.1 transposase domain-containing protein [Mesorhizobium sp. ZC-5]